MLMNRSTVRLVILAALSLGLPSAHAGPCDAAISQFEQAMRASAGNPNAGPFAPQSVGAQIDREPTPASIARAKKRARAAFERELARAKRLDARGDARCNAALARAEDMYNLH
jgi:hypothetical protein